MGDNDNEGIIIRTLIDSGVHNPDLAESFDWYDKAHEKCSDLFKKMTKGKLYESLQ